jgi:hypothetical protein
MEPSELIKTVRFVVATEHTNVSFLTTDFYKFKQRAVIDHPFDGDIQFDIHFKNKKGLPALYNQYINEKYKNEYVIFVHDDVQIADMFFYEKIVKGLNQYDIIGLAGTTKIVNKNTPAWHIMSGWLDPAVGKKYCVGEVAHKFPDGNITTSLYGPAWGRALLLDGLFLGLKIESLLKSNCIFDEDFSFHHYDLSFCLRANEAKLKMGIIQLFCYHAGLGDSMHTEEWRNSAAIFKQKYLK